MAKKFEVTILGVNSAYPIHGRHPSCQIVNYNEQLIMIDCGEGAQIQVSKFHVKKGKISNIFISHLHGDHCYGLPGLLTSFSLNGRKNPLSVHGPIGIKKFLEAVFEASGAFFSYELKIIEYNTEERSNVILDNSLRVETFPMKHRIPTMGFKIIENIAEFNLQPDVVKQYDLSIEEIKAIKRGSSLMREGVEIENSQLTFPKQKARSYAYCSDTVYDVELIPYIKDSSLLYHETTYLDDLEKLAEARMHSTLGQAIEIAKSANIDKLIVGHFSSRYRDTSVFLEQGISKFSGLMLGEEGRAYQV